MKRTWYSPLGRGSKKQTHNVKGQHKLINVISNNIKNGIKAEEGVKAEVE